MNLFLMYQLFVYIAAAILFSCSYQTPQQKKIAVAEPVVKKSPDDQFICNYERQKTLFVHMQKNENNSDDVEKMTKLICDSLIPCWYGTPWNFYGTTEEPGKGTIACGYFVTTVIRDAGLPVQRIKMAQCASEQMIRTVCKPKTIQRYSNKPITEFVAEIKRMGFGLYVAGLDSHTGFIYNDGTEVYFIHANYRMPQCVIKEPALTSSVLSSSNYRVVGRLKM